MYGGLGKVGLDYQGNKNQDVLFDSDDDEDEAGNKAPNKGDGNEYVVPAFSAQAKQLIKAKMKAAAATGGDADLVWEDDTPEDNEGEDGIDSDDEMLCDNIDKMHDELKRIDEHVLEDVEVDINDLDKAAYAVPETDEGYR